MNNRPIMLIAASAVLVVISLPVWFITIMALIAGRSWAVATGLVGIALLAAAAVPVYWVYAGAQEKKMKEAREHNMERQVMAVAKKRNGVVRAADLVGVGFRGEDAEAILDHMAKQGLCDVNLDATKYSGVKTYMFPQEVRMRCQYCGTPVDLNATRCPSCGAPVEWDKARPEDLSRGSKND
jgi:hypothetical protein